MSEEAHRENLSEIPRRPGDPFPGSFSFPFAPCQQMEEGSSSTVRPEKSLERKSLEDAKALSLDSYLGGRVKQRLLLWSGGEISPLLEYLDYLRGKAKELQERIEKLESGG